MTDINQFYLLTNQNLKAMSKLRIGKWDTSKPANVTKSNGLVRINPNKPEFGSMMVIEDVVSIGGGFIRKRNKIGFIVGTVADLEDIIKTHNLKEGDDFCEKVGPHRIVTDEKLESETPEGRAYKEKINPRTNEPLTLGGEKIFWRRYVVPENSLEQDHLIQHDNDQSMGNVRGEQHYEHVNQDEIEEFKKAASIQRSGK